MNTLLLDVLLWDLVLDVNGNLAIASNPYSMAQDAASAIKLFEGELYYDTTKGVPYWTTILGKRPPLAIVKDKLQTAAKTVPGVVAARSYIYSTADRTLKGQVQITDNQGTTAAAFF